MASELAGEMEDCSLAMGGPVFTPRLYQQRYSAVVNLCNRLRAKNVMDMGCAECRLLRLLKRGEWVQELVGVDIQLPLLREHAHYLKPLTTDYIIIRDRPLNVVLMKGSIADPDVRLVDFDLMACVEVIEHLDSDVLERVPDAVFGVLQPKVILMTTPNSEFNVLFPNLHGFRHPDHRFEWTRAQFQTWCHKVTQDYPYTVEFGGVGDPPPDQKALGHCSQMATFSRTGEYRSKACGTPNIIVAECVYPCRKPHPPSLQLCHEAEYLLLRLLKQRTEVGEGNEEGNEKGGGEVGGGEDGGRAERGVEEQEDGQEEVMKIGLEELLHFEKIRQLCSSAEEIREALQQSTVIQLDGLHAVFEVDGCHSDWEGGSDSASEVMMTPTTIEPCSAVENWD